MIPAVILAGGRSSRMGGGDKGLLTLGGHSMLEHVVAALRPQTSALMLNSNSGADLFTALGLEVHADALPGRLGPLAGIHTAMLWARAQGADAVLTVPGDCPFLPANLVQKLTAARRRNEAAIAASNGQTHPVVGLWPCTLAEHLEAALQGGMRRVRDFLAEIPHVNVEFPASEPDPFWNVNTPEDLQRAQALLTRNPPPPVAQASTTAWRNATQKPATRALPEEVAVAMSYDRESFAVMMASPTALEDFCAGFSLSEGIIEKISDITALDIITVEAGIECRMSLAAPARERLQARKRRIAGPVGCGLCGLESLQEASKSLPRVTAAQNFTAQHIADGFRRMAGAQTLNQATRAVHAAAFLTPDQNLLLREDIGRHNALDKLIGGVARQGGTGATGAVLLTSRVSLDLIQKTASFGAGILAAISVPTARAVREAEAAGITLIAVARDDGFEIFTHPERILLPPQDAA
jgi:FdhD protein